VKIRSLSKFSVIIVSILYALRVIFLEDVQMSADSMKHDHEMKNMMNQVDDASKKVKDQLCGKRMDKSSKKYQQAIQQGMIKDYISSQSSNPSIRRQNALFFVKLQILINY